MYKAVGVQHGFLAPQAMAPTANDTLELTEENVEIVLDEVKDLSFLLIGSLFFFFQIRPYLMADGGNVELVEVDGLNVLLKLKGACGSCPSSLTTMTMGIKRRLMERIPVRLLSTFQIVTRF